MICNLLESPMAMYLLAASDALLYVCRGKPHWAENRHTRNECRISSDDSPACQQ